MNWFDILKNQIASTKGKTFQLDFNQPMIEEEKCKETLMTISNRISNKDSIEGYPFNETQHLRKKVFKEEDIQGFNTISAFTSYVGLNAGNLNFLKTIPEEVCCRAIELYKSLADGSKESDIFGGYEITVGKMFNFSKETFAFPNYHSFIEIHELLPVPFKNYYSSIDCQVGGKSALDEKKEKSKETCRKLTRELINL